MSSSDQKSTWTKVGEYVSLGFMLPACTVVGYYLGVLLDHSFHTTHLYLVFLVLGIIAGFAEMVRVVTKK